MMEKSLELSGVLQKWSPALFKGWQTRRVHLKNRKIKWFKEDQGFDDQANNSDARGVINFDFFEANVVKSKKSKKCFEITIGQTNSRVFTFKCEDEK